MTEQAFSLIALHKYWENYQQRLIATITPLSSEQLALPVASHQTIGELLAHMIGARFWWFHRWMSEEEPPDLVDWGDDEDLRQAASLVSAFAMTWQMISPALSRWTAADLERLFHLRPRWQSRNLRTRASGSSGTCLNMRSTMEASFP